jgi:hypothetical protein
VNVTVYHNPVVSIAASSPNPVCFGGTVTLSPTVSAGCSPFSPPYTTSYSWKLGTQQVGTSASAYSVNQVNQSGSYTLEVTNNHGGTACSTTSNSVTATVNPLPVGSASAISLCSGGTANIPLNSSINGTAHAWTSGVTSGSVSGHSGGNGSTISQTLGGAGTVTYTVTPTVTATGCAGQPFTVTATVHPLPAQPVVNASGPLTFCEGGSVTLSAPAGFTYQWSCGGSTAQNVNVTQTSSCTVTVTDQNGCSTTGTATQVTVNATPTASISGSDHFCTGGIAQLVSNAMAGSGTITSQQWNLSGSPIGGETSGTHQAGLSGPYTVTVTNSNGCTFTSPNYQVSEALPPTTPTITAGGPLQFCEGESVELTANASGCVGCTYTWQPSASGTPLTVTQGGNYTVTAQNNCGSETSTATAVVVDANPPQPTVEVNGSTLTCNETGFSYQWYLDGSPITGATSQVFNNADQCEDYHVVITDGNGCSSSSDMVSCPTSINVVDEGSFIVYPNPTSGQFDILLPNV